MEHVNEIEKLIKRWRESAELFVREALNVQKVSNQQKEGLFELTKLVAAKRKLHYTPELCTEEDRHYAALKGISIMSGQGTGKDAMAAWAILWFLCCFQRPKVPCTAPTGHQLKDILWAECSKWMRNGDKDGQGFVSSLLVWNTEKIYLREMKGEQWFAIARTVNAKGSADEQTETLAGLHEDYQMIIVDEASGVPDPVFKPLEGTTTGFCNFVILIFNPTRNTGFAVNTHIKDRTGWICLKWNAEESEMVSPAHIEFMRKKYGRDSNVYRIRVLGEPPKAENNALIPWEWIIAARDRDEEDFGLQEGVKRKTGLDVGGGGDPSVWLTREGGILRNEDIHQNNDEDTMKVFAWAEELYLQDEPDFCGIDNVGIGRGVYDRFRQMGYSVTGVNTGTEAFHPERFFRLRDELWWRLREEFERGEIIIPDNDQLIGELSVIRFEEVNGKIKVEGKRELKKRGIDSPNMADALCMTCYTVDRVNMDDYEAKPKKIDRWRRALDAPDDNGSGWMSQ